MIITDTVQVPNSFAELRGSAHDFIEKPVKMEELRVTLRNAFETQELRRDLKTAQKELSSGFSFDEILGESKAMKDALELARRVAVSDIASVLLYGETGTGKDLFARAIHYASERSKAPYLAINCAAL